MAVPLNLLGIFAAGLLTFASPCILPLAPVYLGLLGGVSLAAPQGRSRVARTLLAATAFALGLGLVFVLMGMAATALGSALVRHRTLLLQLGGLVVFLFGLKYLGFLNVPWLEQDVRPGLARAKGGTILGAFVMGAAFGLGWTPCIGPVLGSVLTFAATSTTHPLQGALLLAAYAAGLALPLIAAAAVAPLALRFFQRAQRWMRPLQWATGGLLAVVGLLLLTDNLHLLAPATIVPTPEPALAAAALAPPRVQPGAACSATTTTRTTGDTACALPSAGSTTEDAAASSDWGTPPKAGSQMVEFVGRTCPVCLRMAPVVKAAERDCAGHAVSVRRVEVDGADGRELARRYGVLGVPTFLFLDASGQEVARLVGEQPLEELEQSLQVLSGAQCKGFRALPPAPQPPPPAAREPGAKPSAS
ncbi:MAG TPA: cytochrome c biogenesis protein CcdA [Myxococcales bacterium]